MSTSSSWLSRIFSASAGGFVKDVSEAVKPFITTEKERLELANVLEALLQQRDSEVEETVRVELSAKERIIIAELQQDDKYTKRGRPTLIYVGLVLISLNYSIIPFFAKVVGLCNGIAVNKADWVFQLPTEFWVAWGGAVGVYAIGRSAEKLGVRHPVISTITGNKYKSKILD